MKAYCRIIIGEEKIDYTVVKFREQYYERVSRIIKTEGKYVGVHIRRTDHKMAKEQSTTRAFLFKMNEVIQEHPEVKFFWRQMTLQKKIL